MGGLRAGLELEASLRIEAGLLGLVLSTSLLAGCGQIDAPPGVAELRTNPSAFQEAFDLDGGVPRLVLLLSPA